MSGKIAMKPAFITALGERISRPSVVNTQESAKANSTVIPSAASTPGTPPSGR